MPSEAARSTGKEVVGILGLGRLTSGECDELEHGYEFEGSDRQQSAGRQGDQIRVGSRFRAAEDAEAGLVDDDLAVAFQVAEGHDVDLLSDQSPALPGSSWFADGRQHCVEVDGVVGGDSDVDVVGRAAGEIDASKDEREVSGGGTDENPPSGSTEGIDQSIQKFAGNREVGLSQGCEGAHRSS